MLYQILLMVKNYLSKVIYANSLVYRHNREELKKT